MKLTFVWKEQYLLCSLNKHIFNTTLEVIILKKRYALILSLILISLSISCVSAIDNNTDIVNEQDTDLISINEDVDNISISEETDTPIESIMDENNDIISLSEENNETISVSYENNSLLKLNEKTNEILSKEVKITEIKGVSLSNNTLSTSITVTPISSVKYKEPTKKQRTFKIGNFKTVLSKSQYKKLYQITYIEDYFFKHGYDHYTGKKYRGYELSPGGLRTNLEVRTNKVVKVKVKVGKKVMYRKARVYMHFSYGEGQCGVAYRYMAYLTHKFANPGYDSAKVIGKSAKYFGKCKQSRYLPTLKKCRLLNPSSVYRRYSYYNL